MMDPIYSRCQQLVSSHIPACLAAYERARPDQTHLAASDTQKLLDELNEGVNKLQSMIRNEPPSRRATAKLRTDQLAYDAKHLETALANMQRKSFDYQQQAHNEDLLLNRRFKPNDSDYNFDAASSSGDAAISMGLDHNDKLKRSSNYMSDMLAMGSGVLSSLGNQSSMLTRIQGNLRGSIITRLGLSDSVLGLIERRTKEDKMLFWALVLVSCILFFIIWKIFG